VVAKEVVQMRNQSQVQGNITASSLQIDAGAIFNGQSQMGAVGNVVVMKEGETVHAKAK
jgi:cytoskeletal protein CcmA (bactofilin family)